MNKYLRSFVIGSSLPVVILYFLRVMNIGDDVKNYSYEAYSIIAPLYFGLMNMLSLYASENFGWDLRKRLIITGLLSPLIVMTVARVFGSYNFVQADWFSYFIRIFINHFLTYNVIIYFLENNV